MLFVIIGIVLGIVFGYRDGYEIIEAILGGLIGFIVGLFMWFVVGAFCYNLPYNEIVTTQEICALNDSSEVEGQKFLFSGYIEENLVYRYVIDTERGKHIEECDVDNAYIKDIESDNPYVEIHKYEFKSGWYYLFAIDFKSAKKYQIFYVPNGTITNEYSVDLQ